MGGAWVGQRSSTSTAHPVPMARLRSVTVDTKAWPSTLSRMAETCFCLPSAPLGQSGVWLGGTCQGPEVWTEHAVVTVLANVGLPLNERGRRVEARSLR